MRYNITKKYPTISDSKTHDMEVTEINAYMTIKIQAYKIEVAQKSNR